MMVLLVLAPMPAVQLYAEELATPIPEVPTPDQSTPGPAETPLPTETLETPTAEIPEVELPSTPTPGTPEIDPEDGTVSPMSATPGGSIASCSQISANGNMSADVPSAW